jgi:hypothetical protein
MFSVNLGFEKREFVFSTVTGSQKLLPDYRLFMYLVVKVLLLNQTFRVLQQVGHLSFSVTVAQSVFPSLPFTQYLKLSVQEHFPEQHFDDAL